MPSSANRFRERPFPGVDGRPRLPFAVNTDATSYESSAENRHVDVAVRVARAWGSWDLGAHVFHGTARNPELRFDPTTVELQPFYALMTQVGIDAQATLESWLLKTELVHRQGKEFTDHVAGVTGFEYSFYDIQGSGFDLGIVGEYLFEDRDEAEADILQNDVLIGLRLALNDAASTEALAGVIVDLDEDEQLYSLEASRRFGSNFKASFAYTGWSDGETPSSLTPFDREDNVRFELGYFF